MTKLLLVMAALAISGFAGAYISVQVRNQSYHPLAILVCTFLSALVWIWQAQDKSMTLAQASVLFDVVYGASYFFGFMVMGQVARWNDWVGMGLAMLGFLIISR